MLLGEKVSLRPKRMEDALTEYSWRTDPELANLDATVPLKISYEEFIVGYAQELKYSPNRQYCFAIETSEGKYIGNCVCYGIDKLKKQAELGIMIGDREYWSQGYGTDALQTLLNHLFNEMNMDRIYLKTLDWNIRAQKCFVKCGFVPCGRLNSGEHNFILMELRRQQGL